VEKNMAKVMIVDDSKFMRRIIREALESGGHEIIQEAENGYDALDMYRANRPDLVTMDITMMGKDGLKTVEELVEYDPEAKIIVISAINEQVLKSARKVDIPAKGFLQKPFDKETILRLIDRIL
jgi:two-component system, chemotaxis family, chemotaxis protein CheY